MKNTTKLVLLFTVLLFNSCEDRSSSLPISSNEEQTEPEDYFDVYFQETFKESPLDGYYIILGEKMCASCENGVFASFSNLQQELNPNKIKIISDFTPDNPIFIDKFKQNILRDTLANFENYLLPRSYITFYKVTKGKIVSFAHITEPEKLNNFLKQENLIPQHRP